jgi:hypothetical protein
MDAARNRVVALGLAFASALWIAGDKVRHPQKMWICPMNEWLIKRGIKEVMG